MKIKAWIKYTEGYLPTPRHRKLRYRECESFEDVIIDETTTNQTKLKYTVGEIEIREYKGKLYKKVIMHPNLFYCGSDKRNADNDTIIGRLKHSFIGYSKYFGFNPDDTKEKMLQKAQEDASKYLLIDGELWEVTDKPHYKITTFGLGNNLSGIGVSLDVEYSRINNDENCFEPEDKGLAFAKAINTAIKRGDTDSIEYIKKCPVIEIY